MNPTIGDVTAHASNSGTGVADEPVHIGHTPPAHTPGEPNRRRLFEVALPDDRKLSWLVTAVIGLLGGLVRFWDLGHVTNDGTPVFDEKHYVPQAWQMLRNGGYEDNPAFELVVHPPVGKQLIAIGEWLFGYTPWGWRVMAVAAGTIMIVLIVRIARRLTRSTLLGALAGILLICDGLSHVQSRVGMLDIFQALFVLAAFGCLLVDRDQMRRRMSVVLDEDRVADSRWGPRFGVRWWRFGCGILLGLACGVKWNGIYFVIAFGVLSVVWDALARRSAGVRNPWRGALVRDATPALWSLLAIPMLVYMLSWSPWFASETAIDRHAMEVRNRIGAGVSWLPESVRSFLWYQLNVLNFHMHLVTPKDHPHPWESKPWAWMMSLRPMLYSYDTGMTGCGRPSCVEALMLIGTPALWWVAPSVLAWALWCAIARMDWRYAAVLVGYGASYLPWFLDLSRQMFFFYAIPMVPFLVLGIVLVAGEILGKAREHVERRKTGLLVVALYTGLVVANFVWLWPILNGVPITQEHWQAELWLPSWR